MSHDCVRDALVVVADGGQAVLGGAVAGDVHDRGAVLERAELVVGGERGAGVVGLVAQRPVQLGGVPDRLVDGEPQVGRVDHQVVACRPRRSARRAWRRAARGPRRARRRSPSVPSVRYSQPRPTGGAIEAIESKIPALVGAHRLEARAASAPAAAWSGCRRGRRSTCSPAPAAGRRRVVDRGAVRSRSVQSTSSAALSAAGTSNGLTSYAETQVTSSCTGSGASSTGRRGHRRRRPGRPRRRSRRPARLRRR